MNSDVWKLKLNSGQYKKYMRLKNGLVKIRKDYETHPYHSGIRYIKEYMERSIAEFQNYNPNKSKKETTMEIKNLFGLQNHRWKDCYSKKALKKKYQNKNLNMRLRRKNNDISHKKWEKLSKEIRQRDKCCLLCGEEKNLTADHLISVINGGTADINNLATLCMRCNSIKSHRDIFEFCFERDMLVPTKILEIMLYRQSP